ncbi:MAG: T9SS type A sorting domain-containing protein [Bacteroidota bacterium]
MTKTKLLKTFYLISMTAILGPIGSIAQTSWYSPETTTDELNTVFFVDSLHGWVGGSLTTGGAGVIRTTTDGGITWIIQSMPATGSINRIVFLSSTIGFAVSGNGAILKTTNAGTTWVRKRSGIGLQSVFFFDSQHGWACGGDTVLSTTDQGETWTASVAADAIALWDISFSTLQVGYAVGLYATCYKSTNGGASWNSATAPLSGVSLYGISFPTASKGVVVGGSGIARSTNAGSSWAIVYNSGGTQLNCVSFADSLHGWAVGTDQIVATADGGNTWVTQSWPTPHNYLMAVNGPDKNHPWVVGSQIILTITNKAIPTPEFFTSTSSLDFGTVATGKTGKDSIYIVNQGTGDLIISSIVSPNPQFTLSPTNADIPPSTGLYFVVTFAPLDSSTQSEYIGFVDNAAGSPQSIYVLGNEGTSTGIAREHDLQPKSFSVSQNYPNPFNPTTVITYQLPASTLVTLNVYDELGRLVRTLVDERQSSGIHSISFDGGSLVSGVYFYRLSAGNFVSTKKLMILK